jgi:hypothetical protein
VVVIRVFIVPEAMRQYSSVMSIPITRQDGAGVLQYFLAVHRRPPRQKFRFAAKVQAALLRMNGSESENLEYLITHAVRLPFTNPDRHDLIEPRILR